VGQQVSRAQIVSQRQARAQRILDAASVLIKCTLKGDSHQAVQFIHFPLPIW